MKEGFISFILFITVALYVCQICIVTMINIDNMEHHRVTTKKEVVVTYIPFYYVGNGIKKVKELVNLYKKME